MYIEVLDPVQLKSVQNIALDALIEFDRICRKHEINYALYGGTLLGAIRHGGFIPWDDDVDVVVMRSDYDRLIEICRTELRPQYFWQSHRTENGWYRLYSKIRVNNTVFRELAHNQHDIHHGVYIDIFPLDQIPDAPFPRKWQYLRYKFWSVGVSSKYINIQYRTGKGKILAYLAKLLYSPFTLSYVYKKAEKTATLYNGSACKCVMPFMSAYGEREILPKEFYEKTKDVMFEGHPLRIPEKYDFILHKIYGDYMTPPPENKRISRHKIVELSI